MAPLNTDAPHSRLERAGNNQQSRLLGTGMGEPKSMVLTRAKLYELVWQEPTRTVAARLGISDVGLAKICRKLHIPRPWRGYWREKETGHARRPPKLPPWPAHLGPEPESIPFRVSAPPNPDAPVPARPAEPEAVEAQRLHEAGHPITVPDELVDALRPVRQAARLLKRQDDRGFLVSREHPYLAIHVSPGTLNRALRIFDAFLKACTSRGWPVGTEADRPWRTHVTVLDEVIFVGIDEKVRTIRTPRKSYTERDWLHPHAPDTYEPTGVLTWWAASVDAYGRTRRTWNDGKRQRVEHCLNDVMIGLVQLAEARKAERRESEARQRQMAEEVRQQHLAAERREREQERRDELHRQVAAWRQSQELQSYLHALQLAASPQISQDPDGRLARWLRWAETYVRKLDPMQGVSSLPHDPQGWGKRPIDLSEVGAPPTS